MRPGATSEPCSGLCPQLDHLCQNAGSRVCTVAVIIVPVDSEGAITATETTSEGTLDKESALVCCFPGLYTTSRANC